MITHLPFLVVGVFATLAAVIAYLTLAANAEANHQDRVVTVPPIGEQLDAFLRALHGTAGERVIEGNSVTLLQNGDEVFPPMLAAIRASRQTVHFSTYIYWAGAIPREFTTALCEAAQRGVAVRLVLDSEGTKPMPHEMVHQLQRAGCHLTWFRPFRWYNWAKYSHRTHRRLLIVDGTIGFTGGIGIADEWSGHAEDPAHWRDTHVCVTGPIVAALQGGFIDNWNQSTEQLLLDADGFPPLPPTGNVPICPVRSTPAEGASSAQRVMAALIAGSTRALEISNAYFLPTPAFIDALCAASDRGVAVRVLVPGPYHNKKAVRRASRHTWPRLVRHGVAIYEYQPTMMHAKTVVADGALVMVSSINFDPRSFTLNAEFGAVIVSREFASTALGAFEADIGQSIRVLPAAVASRGSVDRAVDAICYWLRGQL
jgi:cardiolipin synthase